MGSILLGFLLNREEAPVCNVFNRKGSKAEHHRSLCRLPEPPNIFDSTGSPPALLSKGLLSSPRYQSSRTARHRDVLLAEQEQTVWKVVGCQCSFSETQGISRSSLKYIMRSQRTGFAFSLILSPFSQIVTTPSPPCLDFGERGNVFCSQPSLGSLTYFQAVPQGS